METLKRRRIAAIIGLVLDAGALWITRDWRDTLAPPDWYDVPVMIVGCFGLLLIARYAGRH